MNYCIKCGKQNTESAKFCTGCGSTLTIKKQAVPQVSETEPFSPPKQFAKRTWILISVFALLGIAVAVYFLFLKSASFDGKDDVRNMPQEENKIETEQKKPNEQTEAANPDFSYTEYNGSFIYRSDCFIIVTGSFVEEKYAIDYVRTMKNEGHSNAGYLWIPDFPSLSGKRFYATFIGPYKSYSECENNLRTLKVNSRFWYGKKVSYNPEQIEIRLK